MGGAEALEAEIKRLIVEALALEDVDPQQIETDAALFGEGLGLDSIDALELAMVVEERYGVTIEDDPEGNARIFASVEGLRARQDPAPRAREDRGGAGPHLGEEPRGNLPAGSHQWFNSYDVWQRAET